MEGTLDFFTLMGKRFEHSLNSKRSAETIKERNINKFRKLVAHAQKHSEFYSAIIKENNIDPDNCTPSQFPILTKSDLMENFNDIVTDKSITKQKIADFFEISKNPRELLDNKYFVMHTSGSTGQVGYFIFSKKDWSRGVAHSFRMHKLGFRRKIGFFGATNGHFAGVTISASADSSFSRLFHNVKTFDINSPIQDVIDGLNKFKPDILIGYAQGLNLLAHKKLANELFISPSTIENSGEGLSEWDRAVIKEAFDCKLLNIYACSEHIFMGIGKREFDGIYLLEDDLIFEIDKDYTLVTNLFNYTLPLIRYKMEDILKPKKIDRNRIFPFTKVDEIIGRNEISPVFINKYNAEDFISPHIINEIIIKGIKAFQLQLIDKSSFSFSVITEKGISREDRLTALQNTRNRLTEILTEKKMDNVSFEVREVERLNVDPKTGKFKLIFPATDERK
jgi:phenylacetate-CoA ligase